MVNILHKEISDLIVNAAFAVHFKLGPGLLEALYKRALAIELKEQKIPVWQERGYPVYYRNRLIGNYFADLVVANAVIVETKAVRMVNDTMKSQLINYLRLSGLKVGYLLNFAGIKLQFKRLSI